MASQGGSQSDAAHEIGQIMDEAIAKKRKAQQAKIKKQVKRLRENEEGGSSSQIEEEGTKWFKPGEIAIMIEHMENKYNMLFGNCKKASYKQQRAKAWQQLIDALNIWNMHAKTEVERDFDSVKRKIDNLKQRGN